MSQEFCLRERRLSDEENETYYRKARCGLVRVTRIKRAARRLRDFIRVTEEFFIRREIRRLRKLDDARRARACVGQDGRPSDMERAQDVRVGDMERQRAR